MVICLERGADLHMFQLMPLPLTVSCFSKIQIGFAFLVPAHLCSPGKMAVKSLCVCVCVCVCARVHVCACARDCFSQLTVSVFNRKHDVTKIEFQSFRCEQLIHLSFMCLYEPFKHSLLCCFGNFVVLCTFGNYLFFTLCILMVFMCYQL